MSRRYGCFVVLLCCVIGCSDDVPATPPGPVPLFDMKDAGDIHSSDMVDMPIVQDMLMDIPREDMSKDLSPDLSPDLPQDMPSMDMSRLCLEDEHVQNQQCVACPEGTKNQAGDDPTGSDTACEDICVVRFGKSCDALGQAYLKASNTGSRDRFGYSVAADGRTIVIGAQTEQGGVGGINGEQNDDSVPGSGAVYVFEKQTSGAWIQQAYLKANSPEDGARFGNSVAISGDTIAVGVRDENSDAVGINGTPSAREKRNSGAVYVFVRNAGVWTQQAYIKSSNSDEGDFFGVTVAIDGDILAVGANGEDSASTTIDGDQADNSLQNSGAVYIFERQADTWTQKAYLKAPVSSKSNEFGEAISVSGQTVAVGVNTNRPDHVGGVTYVFVREQDQWRQQAALMASNAGSRFGYSVSLDGDMLAVGAIGEGSNATGINGDQSDMSARNAGAVYIFERQAKTWTQSAYIKASNTNTQDLFGFHVSLRDRLLLVSSAYESSNATGINGDQTNNDATLSGAAYLFAKVGTQWRQRAYIKASNTNKDDEFGFSLALSNDFFVIGAPFEASDAKGVGGDETNNNMPFAGAAYIFE